MDHLKCEFCNSRIGPILPQDMGEGRVMHLCPRCRGYLREGNEQDAHRGQTVNILLDGKVIAKAVIPHLHTTIRHASGKRNF